jgi:hypothetical protein
MTTTEQAARPVQVVLDVLPSNADVEAFTATDVVVNGHELEIRWAGYGDLRHVRRALEDQPDASRLIVVARRLSPGARELLSERGAGWADETGAAEIAVGTIVVSRTGRPEQRDFRQKRWTRSVLAVAEAVLVGTRPTVSEVAEATGLSSGGSTNALRFLTDQGLLEMNAPRGRDSGRRMPDPERLLDQYAAAVEKERPSERLAVATNSRDIIGDLLDTGRRWDAAGVAWAATGAAAASVIAPYLTSVNTSEVYVAADTSAGLESVAAKAGLRPIEGGRMTLRPFPTPSIRRLAGVIQGLRVAPWPRVCLDLRGSGVRGEEAAEHLLEVVHARGAGT